MPQETTHQAVANLQSNILIVILVISIAILAKAYKDEEYMQWYAELKPLDEDVLCMCAILPMLFVLHELHQQCMGIAQKDNTGCSPAAVDRKTKNKGTHVMPSAFTSRSIADYFAQQSGSKRKVRNTSCALSLKALVRSTPPPSCKGSPVSSQSPSSPLSPKDRGGRSSGAAAATVVYGSSKPGTDPEDTAHKR